MSDYLTYKIFYRSGTTQIIRLNAIDVECGEIYTIKNKLKVGENQWYMTSRGDLINLSEMVGLSNVSEEDNEG